jgi:hypothetical protein
MGQNSWNSELTNQVSAELIFILHRTPEELMLVFSNINCSYYKKRHIVVYVIRWERG